MASRHQPRLFTGPHAGRLNRLLPGLALGITLTWIAVASAQVSASGTAATQPARSEVTPQSPPTGRATQPAEPVASVRPIENPHGSATGCQTCHGGRGHDLPAARVEAICVKCHDGQHATREPHPVGRPFSSTVTAPRGWPAPNNQVTCVTCHQVHTRGVARQVVPANNPMFLRGYDGNMLGFCGKCHAGYSPQASVQNQGRYNPHLAMMDRNGEPVQTACAFCHTRPMPVGDAVRTGDPSLRADGTTLCMGCHIQHPDWFTPGHIGAKTTLAIQEALAKFAAQQNHESERPSTQPAAEWLPLGGVNHDTLVCGTCHNPHQQGVFKPETPLGAGAMQAGQKAEQMRGLGKQLCGACHAK